MKVLYAASEALPFMASGGLGDVAGSLPQALRKRLIGCRVVLPMYSAIKEENKKLEEFNNTPVSELIDESLRITPREKKEPKQTKKANTNDNMQSLNF